MWKSRFDKRVVIAIAFLILVGALLFGQSKNFEIRKGPRIIHDELRDLTSSKNLSPITGLACQDYNRRPFAIMMAGDSIVRPLSGIASADIVIEMPVITDGITRYMAIFQCADPQEIGSLRSARHDFIALAKGLDAILVHWGGSHFALEKLQRGVIDNINALGQGSRAFYRKPGIPQPHNGFTSMARLIKTAKKLNYRLTSEFKGYPHLKRPMLNHQQSAILKIAYPGKYRVGYEYDPEKGVYLRFKGGWAQKDRLTGQQVETPNVIVIYAASHQIEGQYNDVDIEGQGKLQAFIGGRVISGTWQKKSFSSKLKFLDEKGQEIKLLPGSIWIQIVQPDQEVSYEVIE